MFRAMRRQSKTRNRGSCKLNVRGKTGGRINCGSLSGHQKRRGTGRGNGGIDGVLGLRHCLRLNTFTQSEFWVKA